MRCRVAGRVGGSQGPVIGRNRWISRLTRQWLGSRTPNEGTEALKLMRSAADAEDTSEKHVAMENRLSPMRELLRFPDKPYVLAGAVASEYS